MGRSAKIAEREAGNLRAGWLQATQTLDIATLTQYLNNGEIVYLLPGPATAELLAPTLARVRSAVDDAEATPQTDAMHRLMTRLLAYRANTLLVTGQSQKAEMLADECLVYLDRFPGADSDGSLRNEISLGFCWIQIARGRFQEADNVCKGVLATAQAQNDPDLQVGALVYLGYSAQERGRYDAAATYRHQGLELALAQKEANLYTFFAYLADVAYLTGKYTLAAQMLTKAAAFLDLVAPFQRLEQPIRWARLDIVDGDLAAARARCLSVLSKARDIAAKNVQVWALNELGRIALIEQQPEEAIGFFEQAVEVADEMGRCKEQARVRIGLGQAALAQARPDKALACFRQVIAIAWPQGILPEVLGALIGLAEIAAQQGNRRQAAEWLGTAAAHPATPHHIRQQAEALLTSLAENASLNAASLEEIVAVVLASAEESSVENTQ
jgi:tetratricopeptide (TPR) repeat protein